MKLVPYALYDCTNSNFVESKKKNIDDLLKRRPENFSRSFYQQSTNAICFLNFALKYEQDMHFISILIIYL